MNLMQGFANARRTLSNKSDVKPLPTLAAIVFPNKPGETEIERVTALVSKAGFAIDKPVENDDKTFMFQQADCDFDNEADVRLLTVSPDLALVIKGFAPWTDALENFDEILAAQGMFNGLGTACNALNTAISMKMQNASDPGEAQTEIAAVLDSFSKYVTALVGALPVNAFKFEAEYTPLLATFKSEAKKREDDAAKKKSDETAAAEAAKKAAKPMKPDGTSQDDWDAMDAAGQAACAAKAKKIETPVAAAALDVNAITAAVLAGITPTLTALGETVDGLKAANTSLTAKVDETLKKAGETEAKISGTMLGSARGTETPTRKAESASKGDGAFDGATDTARAPASWKRKMEERLRQGI